MEDEIIIFSQRDELSIYVSQTGFICLKLTTYDGDQLIPLPRDCVEATRAALKERWEASEK